jgi:hypothetical protein
VSAEPGVAKTSGGSFAEATARVSLYVVQGLYDALTRPGHLDDIHKIHKCVVHVGLEPRSNN